MDVASPLTARTVGRTSLGFETSTIFTMARKFLTLATIPVAGHWHVGDDARRRDSQHPSATGHGHPSP